MGDRNSDFPRQCAICLSIPQTPKVLPCQHIFCVGCLDEYIKTRLQSSESEDDGKPLCPECRRPFSCLPKPETGCDPVGPLHQDFTSDTFLSPTQCCAVIHEVKRKVCRATISAALLLLLLLLL